MANPNCKQCGGTGQVLSFTKIISCDCNETNTTTATTTEQLQINSRISSLGHGRKYAFVADDNGWGVKYIWEVYTTHTATLTLLERVEPANGQPDDFYYRFIFEFPFGGDFIVKLLAYRGTDIATNKKRVTVS